jgi:hypothetical protein
VSYGYGGCRESFLVDCFMQNGEGRGEDFVLMLEGFEQSG